MGQPAARVGDMHACPAHGGGAILSGQADVLIGGMPAARVTDQALCPRSPPDAIAEGEATVLIGGRPAARMGTGPCTAAWSSRAAPPSGSVRMRAGAWPKPRNRGRLRVGHGGLNRHVHLDPQAPARRTNSRWHARPCSKRWRRPMTACSTPSWTRRRMSTCMTPSWPSRRSPASPACMTACPPPAMRATRPISCGCMQAVRCSSAGRMKAGRRTGAFS